jgi:hypothetical protein
MEQREQNGEDFDFNRTFVARTSLFQHVRQAETTEKLPDYKTYSVSEYRS